MTTTRTTQEKLTGMTSDSTESPTTEQTTGDGMDDTGNKYIQLKADISDPHIISAGNTRPIKSKCCILVLA